MEAKNENEIQSLIIMARRYSSNGNTYHSVNVFVNGISIGINKFEYGYGDAYKDTAFNILKENGYFNTEERFNNGMSIGRWNFQEFARNNREKVYFDVVDVNRKRDL